MRSSVKTKEMIATAQRIVEVAAASSKNARKSVVPLDKSHLSNVVNKGAAAGSKKLIISTCDISDVDGFFALAKYARSGSAGRTHFDIQKSKKIFDRQNSFKHPM